MHPLNNILYVSHYYKSHNKHFNSLNNEKNNNIKFKDEKIIIN